MTDRATPEWHDALFSRNPIPMWVYEQKTLAFLEVNAAAVHHYGYSREEFLQMTLQDIRPAEDLPSFLTRIANKPEGVDRAGVWRHLKKDGGAIYVDIVTHPIDFQGHAGILVVAHDVTARELAASQLREHVSILEAVGFVAETLLSTADWRSVMPDVLAHLGAGADVSRAYLFTLDAMLEDDAIFTQRFEWSARHATPEIANELMQRMSFREHGFADWIPNLTAGDAVLGPVTSFSEATRAFLAAQDIRTVLVVPIFVEGTLWGFIGFDECRYEREWTEAHVEALRTAANIIGMGVQRSLLEQQFLHSQKMEVVGFLASGVAHDFNNALAVIFASCDFMRMRLNDEDPMCQDLTEIRRAAERSAALTRQLLSFSRDQRVVPRDIDVNETIRGLSQMIGRLLGEHIEVRLDLSPQVSTLRVDPVQLEQVLVNLAVNARDAMPGGGTLTIATEKRAGKSATDPTWILVRVTDTGSGIPVELRDRIFEPFFTTKPPGKGTGLGLAMVQRAVSRAGGRIEVDSTPGAGTTLTLSLPGQAVSDPLASMPAASPGLGHGEIVLVVEDDTALRHAIVRMLREANYDPVAAAHGSEALARLESLRGSIKLLLTDVLMPGMNGVELARRARERNPHIKVLLISGHANEDLDLSGLDDTGASLLRKPFDRTELLSRVTLALSA